MGKKDYDEEKIWKRLNASIDLRKLKELKTDKERYEFFKKALSKDSRAKNLLKPRAFLRKNLRKLYNRALAQEVAKGDKTIQQSLTRFSRPRRLEIQNYARQQFIDSAQENAIRKAEKKGYSIREVPKVKLEPFETQIGRPSTKKVILEEVTISRYKLKGRQVIAIYKKGKRGPITLEYLQEKP